MSPRVLPTAEVRSIWKRLMGKVTYLRAPVGVTLSFPDGDSKVVKKRAEGWRSSGTRCSCCCMAVAGARPRTWS